MAHRNMQTEKRQLVKEGGVLSCSYPRVVNNYVRRFVRLLLVTGTCRYKTLAWGTLTPPFALCIGFRMQVAHPCPRTQTLGPEAGQHPARWPQTHSHFIPAFVNVPVPTCVPVGSGSMPEGGPAKTVGPETVLHHGLRPARSTYLLQ